MGIFKTQISSFDNTTLLYDGTEVKTATLNSGGTGFAVGDMFVVDGVATGGEKAIGKVLTINAGVVLTFAIIYGGYGYTISNGLTCTKLIGNGTGLIINITVLQTRNCYYGHSLVGNDNNAGTKINPFQTVTKIGSFNSLCVYGGITTENPNRATSNRTIFENESYINGSANLGNSSSSYGLKCKSATALGSNLTNLETKTLLGSTNAVGLLNYSFIGDYKAIDYQNAGGKNYNNTILRFYNFGASLFQNSIICISVDLYKYSTQTTTYPVFKYCLFRKCTLWQWNGVTVPITYTTEANYVQDVYNSLLAYANSMTDGAYKTYFLLMLGSSYATCPIFYTDNITGQTNKVVDDTVYPIFNRYNGSTVLDYSLSANSENRALTMGDPTLDFQFVGKYRPNVGGQFAASPMIFGNPINVNADGSDDLVTPADILIKDSDNNFMANQDSVQLRNRVYANVLEFTRGKVPFGAGSQLQSALNSRFAFGKYRPMTQYSIPQETIEVIPYDTPTVPSATLPNFSMAFNGECRLWYWLAGAAKAGLPVLFSDLAVLGITTDINLTEYGNYAVSNADQESLTLSSLSTISALVALRQVSAKYFQPVLNIGYHPL